MQYTYMLPTAPQFKDSGLQGYAFGPLRGNLDFYYVETETGHETFMISKRISRTYYILSGQGYFTIADRRYDVGAGMVVDVPPKVEYTYSGKMALIAFCRPRWFAGNDSLTRWNPDVVPPGSTPFPTVRSRWARLARVRLFGKSPVSAYLRLNQVLWNALGPSATAIGPMRRYGDILHKLACVQAERGQALNTFFLRNRGQLRWIQHLVERRTETATFTVAVLGCSIGAEAYSIAWTIRRARPDLELTLNAVDISTEAVAGGERGVYPVVSPGIPEGDIFERMSRAEREELFEGDGDSWRVKASIRKGMNWHVRDVRDPQVRDALGQHDLVVANNFLCHMDEPSAEACLRNIGGMVRPNGYLMVSGVDLEVRAKVARELGWRPSEELLEEIHEGDPILRGSWPCHYTGLEPLNKRRKDWKQRYAAAFQISPSSRDAAEGEHFSAWRTGGRNSKVCPQPTEAT